MCNLCRKWLTLDLVKPLDVDRFFEVGFGRGDVSVALAEVGLHGYAIEQSNDAVQLCRQRIEREGLADKLTVENKNLFALGPQAGEYDLAIAYEVLEHIEDDVGALAALHGLLKPRGYLLISVPAHMGKWGAIDVWAGHVRRYERGELEGKIAAAGFEILRTISYGYPLLNMSRWIRNLIYGRELKDEDTSAARTERSGIDRPKLGYVMQPLIPIYSWLVYHVGRPFHHKDIGEQYLVLARKTG